MRLVFTLTLLLSAATASAVIPKPLLAAIEENPDAPWETPAWLDSARATRCLEALPRPGELPEDCNPGSSSGLVGVSSDESVVAYWGGLALDSCGDGDVADDLVLLTVATGAVERRQLTARCGADEDAMECERRRLIGAWQAVKDLLDAGYRPPETLITALGWAEAESIRLHAPLARLGGALPGYFLHAKVGATVTLDLVTANNRRAMPLGALKPYRRGENQASVRHVSLVAGRLLVAVTMHDGGHCSPSASFVRTFPLPRGVTPRLGSPRPTRGGPDAPVLLVEITNFQCPFCARVDATVDAVMDRYGADLQHVVTNNPLEFHKRALPAAVDALAAHRQGRYWSYRKRLFGGQKALEDADLARYAAEEGLDVEAFKTDLRDPGLRAQVLQEQRAAGVLGLAGTPSFLINGKKFTGAQPLEAFVKAIDAELAAARELTRTGISNREARALRLEANLEDGNRGIHDDSLLGTKAVPAVAAPPKTPAVVDEKVWPVRVLGHEPTRGPADARVTVVAFMDLECPFCARHITTLERLTGQFPELRLVFKHNPLAFHTRAQPAALAAIAAHRQGRFWPYVTAAYTNIRRLTDEDLEALAVAQGLDLARFRADLPRGAEVLDLDKAEVEALDARGTPMTYVNGRLVRGAVAYEQLEAVVAAELAKARGAAAPEPR